MARGWESKAVEDQIQSARERLNARTQEPEPKALEMERQRDSLLLQRTRILHQLDGCADPRYRKTLESGLDYLEAQLQKLGWKPPAAHA